MIRLLWLVLLLLPQIACHRAGLRANIQESGLVACVQPGALDAKGKVLTCETSAVTVIGDRVLIANDKQVAPPAAQVFSLPLESLHGEVAFETIRPELHEWVTQVRKIEDITRSEAHDLTLITTAFDRTPETGGPDGARFNNLLAIWGQAVEHADVMAHQSVDIVSSIALRERFLRALATSEFPVGPPYFKIEGLAVIPPNNLLFGIRETGPDFEHPRYGMTVLHGRFSEDEHGAIVLSERFQRLDLKLPEGAASNLGLSAMAYDHKRKGTWIAGSIEGAEGEPMRSQLFFLPDKRWREGRLDSVLAHRGALQFDLPYKLEGITMLDDHTILGVCDEDRTLSEVVIDNKALRRDLHQGVFVRILVK